MRATHCTSLAVVLLGDDRALSTRGLLLRGHCAAFPAMCFFCKGLQLRCCVGRGCRHANLWRAKLRRTRISPFPTLLVSAAQDDELFTGHLDLVHWRSVVLEALLWPQVCTKESGARFRRARSCRASQVMSPKLKSNLKISRRTFFALIQGVSLTSLNSSSFDSLTEVAAPTTTTIESCDLAPRNRLRQREHGHRFSQTEGWSSTSRTSDDVFRKRTTARHSRRTDRTATEGSSRRSPC